VLLAASDGVPDDELLPDYGGCGSVCDHGDSPGPPSSWDRASSSMSMQPRKKGRQLRWGRNGRDCGGSGCSRVGAAFRGTWHSGGGSRGRRGCSARPCRLGLRGLGGLASPVECG
jgi:hypothetical protein